LLPLDLGLQDYLLVLQRLKGRNISK
jgi:hypothetical protein